MTIDTATKITDEAVAVSMPPTFDDYEVALVMNADTDAGSRKSEALLRAGYRVAVTGRHVTHLTRAIQGRSATQILAIAAEPTDRSQVTKLIERVESRFGRPIDLVVNANDDDTYYHRNLLTG